MSLVANLYKTVRDETGATLYENSDAVKLHQAQIREKQLQERQEKIEARERELREKEETKRRVKEQKALEKAQKEAEWNKARKQPSRPRKRFDYEKVGYIKIPPCLLIIFHCFRKSPMFCNV